MIIFLTLFWYFTLKKLSGIVDERLKASRSQRQVNGMKELFLFIFRAEFKETRDQKLISVCSKLRQLLYGYIGGIGAYIVFLVFFHPKY